MTDHTSAEALREALKKIRDSRHSGRMGFNEPLPEYISRLKAIAFDALAADAALSLPQAQWVIITDEMVERARDVIMAARTWEMVGKETMRAALEAALSTPTDRGNAPLNPDEAEEHIAENRI